MIKLLVIGVIAYLLITGQRRLYRRFWHEHLSVDVYFPEDHIFEGDQGVLKETIENKKWLPLAMLKVKFTTDKHLIFDNHGGSRTTDHYYRNDVFRIGGGERVTRTLQFTGGRRGYYTIDEIGVIASDLFLMHQMILEQSVHTELYVYPKPYNSSDLRQSLIQLNGEILSKRRLLEDPFEYRGIREYQPYDDMRRINWKATAKTGEFKVNERNSTSLKSIRIFFNIQDDGILKKEDCVELSLRIVASLCSFFLRQGIQVACYGNGVDVLTHQPVMIAPKAGEGQMDAVYRALARVDTAQPAAGFAEAFEGRLFRETGDTFTCFVSPNHYDDFVELLTRYQKADNQFLWFYPVTSSQRPELPLCLERFIRVIYAGI